MLNEEKVKSMTRAAAYEDGPEKKNIEISSYYRADYVGLQMVKSAVAYTCSFGILCLLWGMSRMEELMLLLSRPDYVERLLRTGILLFVVGLIGYEIAIYAYYTGRYRRARKSVVGYHSHLKQIRSFYETQEAGDRFDRKMAPDGEKKL